MLHEENNDASTDNDDDAAQLHELILPVKISPFKTNIPSKSEIILFKISPFNMPHPPKIFTQTSVFSRPPHSSKVEILDNQSFQVYSNLLKVKTKSKISPFKSSTSSQSESHPKWDLTRPPPSQNGNLSKTLPFKSTTPSQSQLSKISALKITTSSHSELSKINLFRTTTTSKVEIFIMQSLQDHHTLSKSCISQKAWKWKY